MRFIGFSILTGIILLTPAAEASNLASAVARYDQVESTYDTVATIEAERQSTVSAQTSGRIVDINFRAGDYVKAGQVIMRIDTAVADQQLISAQARVREAQVQAQNASDQFNRVRQLLSQHFVSQAQYDQSQAALRSAEARVRSLQADLDQLRTARNFATIVAPYAGVMSKLLVEVGDVANPGTPLATGFDPHDLRATAQIPQMRLAEVQAGRKAYLEIPGQSSWRPVSSLTWLPTADPVTHTTEVRLHLSNPDGLLPGQLVNAHFVIGNERRLVIPVQAVLHRSELTAVYCLHPHGSPELRQVRLGRTVPGGQVEILAGLEAGDRVALDPIAAGAINQP